MAQEKVHGHVELGIDLDEYNHAQVPCYHDHVSHQKQHEEKDLQFQMIGESHENKFNHCGEVSSHTFLRWLRRTCIYSGFGYNIKNVLNITFGVLTFLPNSSCLFSVFLLTLLLLNFIIGKLDLKQSLETGIQSSCMPFVMYISLIFLFYIGLLLFTVVFVCLISFSLLLIYFPLLLFSCF